MALYAFTVHRVHATKSKPDGGSSDLNKLVSSVCGVPLSRSSTNLSIPSTPSTAGGGKKSPRTPRKASTGDVQQKEMLITPEDRFVIDIET